VKIDSSGISIAGTNISSTYQPILTNTSNITVGTEIIGSTPSSYYYSYSTTPYTFVNSSVSYLGGGNTYNKLISFYDGSNENPSSAVNFYGLGLNNGQLRFQVPSGSNSHKFYVGSNAVLEASTSGLLVNGVSLNSTYVLISALDGYCSNFGTNYITGANYFSNTVTEPTPSTGDNSTTVATTEFVHNAITANNSTYTVSMANTDVVYFNTLFNYASGLYKVSVYIPSTTSPYSIYDQSYTYYFEIVYFNTNQNSSKTCSGQYTCNYTGGGTLFNIRTYSTSTSYTSVTTFSNGTTTSYSSTNYAMAFYCNNSSGCKIQVRPLIV
jgi:hypothetical protein